MKRLYWLILAASVAVAVAVTATVSERKNERARAQAESACHDLDRLLATSSTLLALQRHTCDRVRGALKPRSWNLGRKLGITPPAEFVEALDRDLEAAMRACVSETEHKLRTKAWAEDVLTDVIRELIDEANPQVASAVREALNSLPEAPPRARPEDITAIAIARCDAINAQARELWRKEQGPQERGVFDWVDELTSRADRLSMELEKADVTVALGAAWPENSPVDVSYNGYLPDVIKNRADRALIVDVIVHAQKANAAVFGGARHPAIALSSGDCTMLLMEARSTRPTCPDETMVRTRIRALHPGEQVAVDTVER